MNKTKVPQRGIAALLAIFFGGLGIHKFYLDEPGKGALYLVGTLTVIGAPISGLFALIDFIKYCSMSREKWQEKYGK